MNNRNTNNREGFWFLRGQHENFPTPRVYGTENWIGKREFLEKLQEAEDKARDMHCKGFSVCRLCGETNGSVTYEYKGWEWPEGFRHYVEVHNVRPSLAFQEMIIGKRVDSHE